MRSNPRNGIRNTKLIRKLFVFSFMRFGHQRTYHYQSRIWQLFCDDCERAKQIVDSLEGIQHASVHYDCTTFNLMTAADFFWIHVVKHCGHDARRDHVYLSLRDAVFHKPLLELGGNCCDVIRENRDKPVQSARDCPGEPGRTNEMITRQLVRH